jgi:hypothetical protein
MRSTERARRLATLPVWSGAVLGPLKLGLIIVLNKPRGAVEDPYPHVTENYGV